MAGLKANVAGLKAKVAGLKAKVAGLKAKVAGEVSPRCFFIPVPLGRYKIAIK